MIFIFVSSLGKQHGEKAVKLLNKHNFSYDYKSISEVFMDIKAISEESAWDNKHMLFYIWVVDHTLKS